MKENIPSFAMDAAVVPVDSPEFMDLGRQLADEGRWEELFHAYERSIQAFPDFESSIAALEIMGDIARTRLEQPEKAKELYGRALLAMPDSVRSLDGMIALHEAAGETEALALALERRARAEHGSEAPRLFAQAARIFSRTGRKDRAVIALTDALRLDPDQRELREALFDGLLDLGRFGLAAEVLEEIRRRHGDDAFLPRARAFVLDALDLPPQHEKAERILGMMLEIDPEDEETLRLQALLGSLSTPDGVAARMEALRLEAENGMDRHRQARACLSLALFSKDQPAGENSEGTAAKSGVQDLLRQALTLWPGMPLAFEALEGKASSDGSWEGYAAFLESQAEATQDRTARAQLLMRLATTRIVRLADPDGALEALLRACEAPSCSLEITSMAAELLAEKSRFEEAAALLEKQAALAESDDVKGALLFKLADLRERHLKDPEGAAKALEGIIETSPGDFEALERLASIYEGTADPENLLRIYELMLPTLVSQDDRFRLLCEAADVQSDLLDRFDDALATRCRALLLRPGNQELCGQLEAGAQSQSDQEKVVTACLAAARVASNGERPDLFRRAARLLGGPLARTRDALRIWKKLLEIQPDDEEARTAVEAILGKIAAAGDVDSLLAAASSNAERAQILKDEIARLEAIPQESRDWDTLWSLYEKLNEAEAPSAETVERQKALAAQLGRWESLARLCERAAAAETDVLKKCEHLFQRAEILRTRLDKPEDAGLAYLALLPDEGASPRMTAALEALSGAGILREAIAEALLPHYRATGETAKTLESLKILAAATRDAGTRRDRFIELAAIQETVPGKERQTLAWLEKAIRLSPSDADIRGRAEDLAARTDGQAELATLYLELAREAGGGLARTLLIGAADLAASANEFDLAIQALDLILSKGPDAEALGRLREFAKRADRPAEQVRALQGLLELTRAVQEETGNKDADETGVRLELADILERQGKDQEAARLLEEHLELTASPSPDLLERLARLCLAAGDKAGAQKAISQQLELAEAQGDRASVARLKLRRSRLIEGEGDGSDASGALSGYAKILADRPKDAEALAALEKMLEVPERRQAAARVLEAAYQASRNFAREVQILEILAEGAADASEKVRLLRRAAQLYAGELQTPDLAFAALAKVLPLAPEDAQLRIETRKLAESADALESYVEILEEAVQGLPPTRGIPLLKELAEVCEKKLGEHEKALECHERIAASEPENVEALKGIHRLCRKLERPEELAKTAEALGRLVFEDQERANFWREAGTLYEEKLGDAASAARVWRALAESDATSREAARALVRLYESLERPEDLAFALELRCSQEGDTVEGRQAAFRLATLKKNTLNDPRGALDLFRKVLAGDPSHAETLDALENWVLSASRGAAEALGIIDPILAKSGEHELRVKLREALMTSASSGQKPRLASEIRLIEEVDLQNPDQAFMSACRHFSEGIDREATLSELERLARQTDNTEILADICEDAVDSDGLGDELKIRLLRRAAALRESLDDAEQAIALYSRILDEIPGDRAAFNALTRLYEKTDERSALADACLRQLSHSASADERKTLQLRAARALSDCGRFEESIEQARAVLAADSKSLDALTLLEKAHGQCGQWREQADVLRSLCELLPTPPERERAALARAQILEEKGEPAEAIDAYAKLLRENPGDQRAVSALEELFSKERTRPLAAAVLEEHYRASDDARRLCEVLEVKASLSPRQARAEILAELARLREGLGEKPLAFTALLRALSEDAADEQMLDSLERLATETDSFEELAAAYEDALERHPSEEKAISLNRRIGGLCAERLGDIPRAAEAYEAVSLAEPDNLDVLDTLARLYRRLDSARKLVDVLRRRAGRTDDAPKKTALLMEIAQVAETSLDEPETAIEALKGVLAISPSDIQAEPQLAALLEKTGRYSELAELLERSIDRADSQGKQEQALELRLRLGCLKRDCLSDPRAALSIFTTILFKRPGHPGAIRELEQMAEGEGTLKAEAALALEPIFETSGDQMKLIQVLESRAQTAEPAEKAALLRRIAQVYEGPLENADMGFVYAGRALEAAPDDTEILDDAVRMARASGTQEELISLLEEVIPSARTDSARAAMLRALASFQAEDGSLDQDAIISYRRLLSLLPGDAAALEALSQLYRQNELWGDLVDVLRLKLAIAEDTKAATELRRSIAEIQSGRLGDADAAITTLRQLLESAPEDMAALERLEVLCAQAERYAELADVLAREIDLDLQRGNREKALDRKLSLAILRDEKLLDRAGALTLFEEFLKERPGHSEAINQLEKLVSRDYAFEAAGDLLADALRRSGQNQRLAALLDERAASTSGPRRLEFLVECARLRIHFGRYDLAFMSLCQALREDPSDEDVRALLRQTASHADTYDELAELYLELLIRLDGAEALSVSLELGQIYEEKLADPARAIEAYEKARIAEPPPGTKALTALLRLYGGAGDVDRQLEILEALTHVEEDDEARAERFFRIGQLCESALNPPSPDKAARAYEEALALKPDFLEAAQALAVLYESARRFDRLMEVLEMERPLVQGAELEKLIEHMADVALDGMHDTEKAIALYGELRDMAPRSAKAYAALERLYEETGKDEPLVLLLQDKIAQTVEPRELLRLYDKKGRALARLGRDEEAIRDFQAALDRDPRTRPTLEALCELRQKAGPSDELAAILRRLIPLQDSIQEVKAVRLRFAEVLAAIGKRVEALDAARRVLDLEPHTIAEMQRVGDLFQSLNSPTDQIRALELQAMTHIEEDEEDKALELFYAIAELQTDALKKPLAAATSYERILDIEPASRNAFDKLKDIYSSQKEWRKLSEVYERYLAAATDSAERLELYRELIQLQEQKLGQKDVAFITCCKAFSEAPQDEALQQEAHRLAEDTDSWDGLAAIYEEIVETLESGPDFVRIVLAYARIEDEKLDDPDEAESLLRRVLQYDPTCREALDALAEMFIRRGRTGDYIGSLEQKLEVAASIEERKRLLSEIARTQEEKLNDVEEAASALRRALELEPDRETLRALVELYRRHREPNKCIEALERARDFETDPHLRAQLQVELSEIYERELGDDETAVSGFRLALEFEPDNRDALAALERIFTKLDRAAELLEVYRKMISLETPEEAIHLQFKSAAIWQGKLQNLERADQCLMAVLDIDPENLQAVRNLETLRRLDAEAHRPATRRWEDLLRAYEYHLGLGPTNSEQVSLLVAMGEVQKNELGWTDEAFSSFCKALEKDPLSRPAIHALGLLYEESGDAENALEMLGREIELLGRTREAAELFCRMGAIHLDKLESPQEAAKDFRRALELDDKSLPAIRALQKLYENEDKDQYLSMLVRETESATDTQERIRAHLNAAEFYQEAREDLASAAKHYEKALELDGRLLEAARPLSDICISEQRWERAEQLLDIVVTGLTERLSEDSKVAGDLCRQFYRLGYVCEKLKKSERALSAYERAYQFDSTYLPSAEGYANRLVAAGRYADAVSVYQAILIHHSEELTELEVVDIYWQTGDLYQKQNQPDRAQREFEKALSHDAHHDPSLRSMAELCEGQERWDEALDYLEKVAALMEGNERFELLCRAGAIAKDKLHDSYRAIEEFSQAHELSPNALKVLDNLLVLYTETRQSARAVEILEQLLALTDKAKDPARACKLYCALGEVCRDGLRDIPRAAEAFNAALDIDYRCIQAFAALESMLGSARQWPLLEQNYHRMLQRLPRRPETQDARMAIFKALASFYEQIKRDLPATLQIYQLLAKSQPQDGEILEKYARLAAAVEGNEVTARDAYRQALPYSAAPQNVVQAIAQLSAKARDYDSAYVAAQVAQYILGEVGPDEREILTKLSPYAQRREQARRPVSDPLWMRIYHPRLAGPMGQILALIYNQLGAYFARRHATFGIDPRINRVDQSGQEFALNMFRYNRQLCGMPDLELYSPYLSALRERMKKGAAGMQQFTHPEKGLFLEMIHVHPIALKAGGALFSETDQKTLTYHLVREMTFCRPELVLARMLPVSRLEALFQAALYYSVPGFRPTADLRAIEAEGRILARLGQQFLGALSQLGQQYVQKASADDLRTYVEAAELTANRAATLLCSDIRVAMALMSKDAISRVPLRSRCRDLLLFCMSADYARLRAELGLNIEIKLQ